VVAAIEAAEGLGIASDGLRDEFTIVGVHPAE
jgi:hypothetical protein